MDRITTISNVINRIPQMTRQDGDIGEGPLNFPISRLNNIILEAEAELDNLVIPYFDVHSSTIESWASHPEPLSGDRDVTGAILKAHIEVKNDAPTQFIIIEFKEVDGNLVFSVKSDIYGKLVDGNIEQDYDVLSIAGFKIKKEAFMEGLANGNIFGFSIYQHHPSILSIYSLKVAVAVLEKVFTQDMPESPATAGDYGDRLNQFLNQMRNGRAYLKASAVKFDTTPLGVNYDIDHTGTDVTEYLTED